MTSERKKKKIGVICFVLVLLWKLSSLKFVSASIYICLEYLNQRIVRPVHLHPVYLRNSILLNHYDFNFIIIFHDFLNLKNKVI